MTGSASGTAWRARQYEAEAAPVIAALIRRCQTWCGGTTAPQCFAAGELARMLPDAHESRQVLALSDLRPRDIRALPVVMRRLSKVVGKHKRAALLVPDPDEDARQLAAILAEVCRHRSAVALAAGEEGASAGWYVLEQRLNLVQGSSDASDVLLCWRLATHAQPSALSGLLDAIPRCSRPLGLAGTIDHDERGIIAARG